MRFDYLDEHKLLTYQFASPEEFLGAIGKKYLNKLGMLIDMGKWRKDFICVDSYAELQEKMKFDKELMDVYFKSEGYITSPKTKSYQYERQYRDSGARFDYGRYLEGRPCVYKMKPYPVSGSHNAKVVHVVVMASEWCHRTKEELMYKTMAVIEVVKALQSNGKNVEIDLVNLSQNTLRSGEDLCIKINLKKGNQPLVVPKIVSVLSPYFYRCYCISALRVRNHPTFNGLDTKGFGKKVYTSGMGYARPLDCYSNKEKKDLFRTLGIDLASSVVIDTDEILSLKALLAFREKHGILVS